MQIANLFELSSNPLLAFCAAAAIALSLGYLAQWVGRRVVTRVTRHLPLAASVLKKTSQPLQLAVPLLFLQFVLLAAPDSWTFMPTIRHGVGLVFIGAMTWLANRVISGVAESIISLRPLTGPNNLDARRIHTQTRVIARTLMFLVALVGVALMLMTFSSIRAVGTSVLASAGLAGIVAGVAARPVLSNLIAGLQLAVSQPLRLDDVLIVEGEWGRVQEITGTYVVLSIWDQRRLIIPLQWFIEHPFQNWTHTTSDIMGTVFLWVDYRMPLEPLRAELERLCREAEEWDGRYCGLQVTDASERGMQVRALMTSTDSGKNWDLRCKVREGLISFVQNRFPEGLPRVRAELPAEEAALSGRIDQGA